jgi:hypothetical protein
MAQLQATRIRISRGRATGLLLAMLGLGALAIALGQPFALPGGRPGPGFVPTLLSGALVALGLLHAAAPPAPPAAPAGARAGLALCGAVAGFALLLPVAGFLPAAFLAGAAALAAAPGLGLPRLLGGAAVLALLAAALFLGALGLPTPLIGAR